MFQLREPVGRSDLAAVLPEDVAPLLLSAGDDVRPAYDLSPYGDESHDWFVVSDLTDPAGRPARRDHVLGIGSASTTLAQLTVRRQVRRALDVGTGCGVQALHLFTHAAQVTATDAVPRALRLAATTAALNQLPVELVQGDLTEPVAHRRFDLVVCNPPFVVGPSTRYDYRDGGLDGDELSRRAVRSCAAVLDDGGVAQLLVNWLHVRGEDWRDRVGSWVGDLGVDAWLLERDAQEPADYVSTWSDDVGERRDDALAAGWLDWLDARRVEAVGLGWVVLRRASAPYRREAVELLQPVDQPLGQAIEGWLDRTAWLRGRSDQQLLGHAFRRAADVRLDSAAMAGDAGWQPVAAALSVEGGFRWSLPTDDAVAALVAGCDGTRPLELLVAVLATGTDVGEAVGEADFGAAVAATVRGLVDRGILLP